MTKFEEVKRPKKAYIDPFSKRDVDFTGVAKKFTEAAQTLKEWKEYAFLLEDKLKLQQQALPVVPECVAGAIESIPDHYSAFEAISLIKDKIKTFPEGNEDWVPIYKWLFDDINNQDIFAIAFITRKYEVEKPQLFYLKNKLTTSYLALDINTGYYEHWGEEIIPKLLNKQGYKLSFTQQEIDSMQTGSYEQIKVEEEK